MWNNAKAVFKGPLQHNSLYQRKVLKSVYAKKFQKKSQLNTKQEEVRIEFWSINQENIKQKNNRKKNETKADYFKRSIQWKN